MVHQRQGLSFGFKPGDDVPRVHAIRGRQLEITHFRLQLYRDFLCSTDG